MRWYTVIKHDFGTIDAPIDGCEGSPEDGGNGNQSKDARTHFQVIELGFENYTLVECSSEKTGRTHQIRVQA